MIKLSFYIKFKIEFQGYIIVLKTITQKSLPVLTALALSGCSFQGLIDNLQSAFSLPTQTTYNSPIKMPSSVVVCRSRQCAAAKLSMSREYIYNSLFHLFENNNHKRALVCAATPGNHTCTENYITMPITVGITPAYAYIDSVDITDISVNNKNSTLNLILNYNVTYNGQTPTCVPAKSIMYVRNINNIILEDAGYNCKMTTIGQTTVKTLFVIDYIDLDYGFIGGYYSIGFSGPAYGGGSGYMMLRLPKDAYPLAPELKASGNTSQHVRSILRQQPIGSETTSPNSQVQVFPLEKK